MLVCAGCSQATGTVTGTVTYNNKPLTKGMLTFVTPNGTATGTIEPDGKYRMAVPVGTAKVSVFVASGPRMPGGPKGGMKGGKDLPPEAKKMLDNAKGGSGVTIPQKYTDPETSGLSVNVKSGQNPYDIPLKD